MTQASVPGHAHHGGGQGLLLAGRHQDACLAVHHDLGHGGDVRTHDGQAHAHGFEEHQAQAFPQGAHDEDLRGRHQLRYIPPDPGEDAGLSQFEVPGHGLGTLAPVSKGIVTHQQETQVRSALPRPVKGAQQQRVGLLGGEARHTDQDHVLVLEAE